MINEKRLEEIFKKFMEPYDGELITLEQVMFEFDEAVKEVKKEVEK